MTDDKLIVYTGGVLTKGVAEAEDAAAAAAAAAELAGDEADRAEVAAGDAQDAADALEGAIDDIATAQETADAALSGTYLQFANRSAAIAAEIPAPVAVIAVAGLQYVSDPAGTAMETADGRKWSPGGEVWPHHFGDMTGNNCQVAINAAIDWLASKGGGDLHIPQGEYTINGKIVIKSNINLIGKGRPIINLLSSALCTMIEGEDYLTLSGSGSNGGISAWSIRNFYLNGRRPFVSGSMPENEGHCIAVYGRDFIIDNVYARDAYRNGIICEYATGALAGQSPYNGRYNNLTIVGSGESGLVNRVSDSHISSVNSLNNGHHDNGDGHSHIWLNVSGNCRAVNLQTWQWGNNPIAPDYGIRIDTPGVKISGGVAADGKVACIAVLNNNCDISNMMTGPIRGVGSHLIVAGQRNNININAVQLVAQDPPTHVVIFGTPSRIARSNRIVATSSADPITSMVHYDNSTGRNDVQLIGSSAATVMFDGTPHATDTLDTRGWDGALAGYCGATHLGAQVVGRGAVSASDAISFGGGAATAARSIAEGQRAVARIAGTKARANGRFSADGDSQIITMEGRATTTDDTQTALTYGATPAMQVNSTWLVEATVLGRQTGGGTGRYAAKLSRVFSRAASTSVASSAAVMDETAPVTGWGVAIEPNVNSFAVLVTGPADGTVRWLADIRIVEILQ